MSVESQQPAEAPAGEGRGELGARARAIGIVLWSSFLAACAGTMFFFAFIAPADIAPAAGADWENQLGVYSLGFFGLWCLAAVASTIALYLQRGLEHK